MRQTLKPEALAILKTDAQRQLVADLCKIYYNEGKKQNIALVEALKLTLLNAKAPEATDWPAVVERLERAIAQAEGVQP